MELHDDRDRVTITHRHAAPIWPILAHFQTFHSKIYGRFVPFTLLQERDLMSRSMEPFKMQHELTELSALTCIYGCGMVVRALLAIA